MKQRRAAQTGLVLFGAASLLVVAGGALVAGYRTGPARGAPGAVPVSSPREPAVAVLPVLAPVTTDGGEPTAAARSGASERAETLVQRLVALLESDAGINAEALAEIQAELVALGETAASAIVQRIDGAGGAAPERLRARLFDVLRRVPGKAAEDRLIREARSGSSKSIRPLAIEALGARRTARAIDALERIVETDPELPERPLIVSRDQDDTSTELPDEVVFTPRMQALSALAATREARAGEVLVDVLHDGPSESLRMEAARHLEVFRDAPSAGDALKSAAIGDASPYVRLAAIHALAGSSDRALAPMLESIAARDVDAGVRALARQVLASIAP